MSELTGIYSAGGNAAAHQDHIDVGYWFRELLLTYKYGEKFRFRRALDKVKPYMDDRLIAFFEEIYDQSTWTNPITGKKGY